MTTNPLADPTPPDEAQLKQAQFVSKVLDGLKEGTDESSTPPPSHPIDTLVTPPGQTKITRDIPSVGNGEAERSAGRERMGLLGHIARWLNLK